MPTSRQPQRSTRTTSQPRSIAIGGSRMPVSPAFTRAERLPGLCRAIREADVVILLSATHPPEKHCAYGRSVLEYIVRSRTPLKLNICTVTIDFDPQYLDLEIVLAMIVAEKGHHEYQSTATIEEVARMR